MTLTNNERTAYYRGRSATFAGVVKAGVIPTIYATPGEREQWKLGVRDARAEMKLDADVEWEA